MAALLSIWRVEGVAARLQGGAQALLVPTPRLELLCMLGVAVLIQTQIHVVVDQSAGVAQEVAEREARARLLLWCPRESLQEMAETGPTATSQA